MLNNQLYPFIGELTGVSHMHERNIVHGDLKLDNTLLSGSGTEIRISDLGGAIEIGGELRASTLSFSAPEQVDFFIAYFKSLENKSLLFQMQTLKKAKFGRQCL